ncbi:unnamed protein product [Adineta steineri]|uniref:F-box domain-containing protein n=1 Tax=Adineta steineri TaxID=433720 RepID=A0A813NV96_9BILA|nr:unnamed protein product [Adineta steineri]
MEESYLPNLPVELLHRIFHFCDVQTILCKISNVCKKLHSIVNQYDQHQLTLDIHKYRTNERSIPDHVLYNRVVSLMTRWHRGSEYQKEIFISALLQCTRLRHLTLHYIDDTSIQSLFQKTDKIKLVSLTIKYCSDTSNTTFRVVSLFAEKSKLQKLSWKDLFYKAEVMSWPDQCKLKFLSIDRCFYSQYSFLLRQLPCLETFQVKDIDIDENSMYLPSLNFSFNSQLTHLSITCCSLSTEHLRSLISKTPKLCELDLIYSAEMFKSLINIHEWEKFVRMELSFLKKFQFFISYEFAENDTVRLDTVIAPFRDSFWLNEKCWFTVCEQGLGKSNSDTISLFTIPVTEPAYHSISRYRSHVQYGISSKDNTYYINDQSKDEITLETVHKTFPVLDLTYDLRLKSSHLQFLAHALQNNQTTVELNLAANEIKALDTQYIVEALLNNTTLVTLSISANNIGDQGMYWICKALDTNITLEELELACNYIYAEGAKYLADALRKNIVIESASYYFRMILSFFSQTLTKFELSCNKIGAAGVHYIAEALRHNTTLTILNLHNNDIGNEGAKHIADVLNTNQALIALSMTANNIGDDGMSYICKALHKNITLKELDLNENKITDDGAKSLSETLQNNNTLEKIYLKKNNIGDDGATNLAIALKTNTTVTILNLATNKIDITGAQCLYDELQKNTTLEGLYLSGNRIGIAGAKYLADALRENTTLKTLYLSYNTIGVAGVDYFIEALRYNPIQSLTKLILYPMSDREYISNSNELEARSNVISVLRNSAVFSRSDFEGDVCGYCEVLKIAERIRKNLTSYEKFDEKNIGSAGAQHIGDALRYNTIFLKLEVKSNQMTNKTIQYLNNILLNNSTLQTINLISNNITSTGARHLSDLLRNHITLTTFCLINNRIGDDGLTYLSPTLKDIKTLEILILSRIDMGPIGTESLANALENNTTLSILRLNNNEIGVEGIQSIMIILQRNKTLVEIDLSNNEIGNEGTRIVADFLSTNITLLKLNLGINEIGLSGVKYLGDALEKNTTLTSLYLRRNDIDQNGIEYFSQSLKRNQTLKQIDVSCNPIGRIGIEYLRDLLKSNTTLIELKIGFNYKNYQGNLVNYTNS